MNYHVLGVLPPGVEVLDGGGLTSARDSGKLRSTLKIHEGGPKLTDTKQHREYEASGEDFTEQDLYKLAELLLFGSGAVPIAHKSWLIRHREAKSIDSQRMHEELALTIRALAEWAGVVRQSVRYMVPLFAGETARLTELDESVPDPDRLDEYLFRHRVKQLLEWIAAWERFIDNIVSRSNLHPERYNARERLGAR